MAGEYCFPSLCPSQTCLNGVAVSPHPPTWKDQSSAGSLNHNRAPIMYKSFFFFACQTKVSNVDSSAYGKLLKKFSH